MVRLLGPLVISRRDGDHLVAGRQQRAVLALLALRLGHVVPADELVEQAWPEAPPATAAAALRVHIARLRRTLVPEDDCPDPLPHQVTGYVLNPTTVTTDVAEFVSRVERARADLSVGDDVSAAQNFRGALELRRGRVLLGLDELVAVREQVEHLEEVLQSVEEELLDVRLAQGDHAAVCADAAALVAQSPFRERRTRALMLALYRSGRQADALAACARTRQRLADELGVDPGPELQELEGAVLRQEAHLGWAPRVAPPAGLVAARQSGPAVSEALRDLVGARLSELPDPAKQVVVLSALLGDFADDAVLAAATRLELGDLGRAIRLGQDSGLLGDSEGQRVRPSRRNLAEAVLAVVDAREREQLHIAAAEGLERVFGETGLVPAAQHLVAAGRSANPARTAGVGVLAAEHCLRKGSPEEAVDICGTVLEALGHQTPPKFRVDLLTTLACAEASQGHMEVAERTWRTALEEARQIADPERFALAVLAHAWARRTMLSRGQEAQLLHEALARLGPAASALRIRLSSALIGEAAARGQIAEVEHLADEVREAAEAVGDSLALVTALYAEHVMMRPTPRLSSRREVARRLEDEAASLGDPYWSGAARMARLYDEFVEGDADAVDLSIRELGRWAEQSQSPRLTWHNLLARTTLLRLSGDYAAADQCAERALLHGVAFSIADAAPASLIHRFLADLETSTVAPLLSVVEPYTRQQPDNALGNAALAIAAVQAGRLELAQSAADAVIAAIRGSVGDESTPLALALLAEAELAGAGLRHIEELTQTLAPYTGQFIVFGQVTGSRGPVDRILGRLTASAGEPDSALILLRSAEEQCRRASWWPWVVQCVTDRVVVLRDLGRTPEAEELAAQSRPAAARLGLLNCAAVLEDRPHSR
nr:AfsR/SARP family transcriptional regulator [Nocardioides sp. S-34]